MRIGIDYCRFDPEYRGGLYHFSLGLTKGLLKNLGPNDSVVIIASSTNEIALKAVLSDLPVTFKTVPIGKWNKYANWTLWVLAWLVRNFKFRCWWDSNCRSAIMQSIDNSIDVVIVPTAVLNFYGLKKPSILCVHDIQHEYHPELFSFAKRVVRWGTYRASCWQATAIQASSQYIRDCLLEKFDFLEPTKIFIAIEGVDLTEFATANHSEQPPALRSFETDTFVFYPAQLWPHKNHLLLIEALAMFQKSSGMEMACVLTGQDYGQWAVIEEHIQKYELKRVAYLGRVSLPQLLWLYANCRAVLALGFHESSSLPVREGAAFGKPLIAVNIPPNIEAQAYLRLTIVDKDNPTELARVFAELNRDFTNIFAEGAENKDLIQACEWAYIARDYMAVADAIANVRQVRCIED